MMPSPLAARRMGPFVVLVGVMLWHAAQADELPADREALLHLKVLSYDRNLKKRSGGKVVVGVVYRGGSAPSEKRKTAIGDAFRSVAKTVTVQDMSLSVVDILFDAEALTERLREAGVTVIYVAPELETSLTVIAKAATALKAPTLTGSRSAVKAGLAVAVAPKGGKPSIIVNVKVAKALGMDLDAKILSVAELLK